MKKLTVLLSLILIVSASFAQKGKVKSAYSNFLEGKYTKAKELIDAATVHSKSKDEVLTWVYRGAIYIGINNAMTDVLTIDKDALPKAIEAFTKAKELNTDGEYAAQIDAGFVDIAAANFNLAVLKYNAKDYAPAGDYFSESFAYAKIGNQIDTNSVYYAAASFNYATNYTESVKWYEMLVDFDFDETIYSEYANVLIELEQFEKASLVISKGLELYPEDYHMIITKANVYLKTKQLDKALENLELALSIKSDNFTVFYVIGTMYTQIFEDTNKTEEERFIAYDKAEDAYKQVIEMEPMYFDAVFNFGANIFNKGVYFLTAANELSFGDKNYDVLKNKGDQFLVDASPVFEKALELKPDDASTLFSLREIYSRIGDNEKYKIINQSIIDLGLEQ